MSAHPDEHGCAGARCRVRPPRHRSSRSRASRGHRRRSRRERADTAPVARVPAGVATRPASSSRSRPDARVDDAVDRVEHDDAAPLSRASRRPSSRPLPVVETDVRGAPADGGRPGRQHESGDLQAAIDDGRPRTEREQDRRPFGRRAAVHDECLAVVDHRVHLELVEARDVHALRRDRETDRRAAASRPARTPRRAPRPRRRSRGSARSSHAGIHHACRPNSTSTAGISVIRTRNASIATPTARPNAIGWIDASPSGTNAAKTANMMIAAAVTTRADPTKPSSTARYGIAVVDEVLPHAADQEHLVVHREAEEHAHEDDRHEADRPSRRRPR